MRAGAHQPPRVAPSASSSSLDSTASAADSVKSRNVAHRRQVAKAKRQEYQTAQLRGAVGPKLAIINSWKQQTKKAGQPDGRYLGRAGTLVDPAWHAPARDGTATTLLSPGLHCLTMVMLNRPRQALDMDRVYPTTLGRCISAIVTALGRPSARLTPTTIALQPLTGLPLEGLRRAVTTYLQQQGVLSRSQDYSRDDTVIHVRGDFLKILFCCHCRGTFATPKNGRAPYSGDKLGIHGWICCKCNSDGSRKKR